MLQNSIEDEERDGIEMDFDLDEGIESPAQESKGGSPVHLPGSSMPGSSSVTGKHSKTGKPAQS